MSASPFAELLPVLAVAVPPSAGLRQRQPAAASLSEVSAEPACVGRGDSGPAHLKHSRKKQQLLSRTLKKSKHDGLKQLSFQYRHFYHHTDHGWRLRMHPWTTPVFWA